MSNMHKGNPGEAYLNYLGIMAAEEFNAATIVPSLFYEQNFDEEQLLDIATLVNEPVGARIVSSHPNATQKVKAKLIFLTISDLGVTETIDVTTL